MKITPLDIQQRDFEVRVRGYDRQEVQAFLRSVSQAVEQLVKENTQFKERAEQLETQVNDLRKKEATLNDLLVTAQSMADGLKETARKEADLMLKEAQLKAENLLKRAHADYEGLQRDILALRKERMLALEKLRSMLQTFSKMVEMEEIDLNSLSGDTSVDDVTRNR
ncbi:MAG TPA: DivIVA domain-containing protein [Nitrospirales bacterium]|nr:DivIVA domain-containing protein [Nitrospirales bacterium]